jgi:hypothetical protein
MCNGDPTVGTSEESPWLTRLMRAKEMTEEEEEQQREVRPASSAPAPATATSKRPMWSKLFPFGDEKEVATRMAAEISSHWWWQKRAVDGATRAGGWRRRTQ